MRGASALNSLLGEFRDAPIQVQVIWEPVLKTDIAPPVNGVLGLLRDQRGHQYWDPARCLSAELARSINRDPSRFGREDQLPAGFVCWDVVAVFESSSHWGNEIPAPIHLGGPVIREIDNVRRAILRAQTDR